MTITINNDTIELKNTMRAILVFEQISGNVFQLKNTTDMLIYFYSVIIASKPDTDITFDNLVDAIDNNPNLLSEFSSWVMDNTKRDELIMGKKKEKANH